MYKKEVNKLLNIDKQILKLFEIIKDYIFKLEHEKDDENIIEYLDYILDNLCNVTDKHLYKMIVY